MYLIERGSHRARVVLANEPRSYREAVAEAIRSLRPSTEVETVEPDNLDAAIGRSVPDMVVCSKATGVVRRTVPVWVELYPEHGARSFVSIGGTLTEYGEIQLPDLLDIVDRAVELAL